ncbi:UNVERIFIED_CONTAM: Cytosolic carboxypeptidase 1 [Siphonaria sp. JEL0065]|nr:Cytosolic carboxypeptidase 1 [Siphonaria sp. JEL0065]
MRRATNTNANAAATATANANANANANASAPKKKAAKTKPRPPLPLDAARNSRDLDDAIAGASAKLGQTKILPNILSRARDQPLINFQYGASNISPPSSLMAAKAFDQLAILLAEPIPVPAENANTSTNSNNATIQSTPIAPVISFSAPVSRRSSSTNLTPNSSSTAPGTATVGSTGGTQQQPLQLPRNSSDPLLYATNPLPSYTSPPANDRELRRRVVKQCLEIKRILDKENVVLVADSPLHKIFFSKFGNPSGAGLLLKCIRIIPDIDICIIVTNLLLRIITSASDSSSNIAFLAKKNASVAVVTCLVGIVTATSNGSSTRAGSGKKKEDMVTGNPMIIGAASTSNAAKGKGGGSGSNNGKDLTGLPSGVPSLAARMDEAILNIFSVIVKLGKHDPKLPVIARLHGSVEIVTDIVKKWHDRKDYTAVLLGFQVLRVFAVKNESNIMIMHKRGIIETIFSFFKTNGLGAIREREARESQGFEVTMDLLALFAKHETVVADIISVFGIQYFLNLFNGLAGCDSIRKAILRLLRAIVETAPGRKEFNLTDGLEVLTSSLEEMIKEQPLTPEEEFTLESLCPENHLLNWVAPPVLDIPTRILQSVYPTDFEFNGVPFILHRDPDDFRPSLKFPVSMTTAVSSATQPNVGTNSTPTISPSLRPFTPGAPPTIVPPPPKTYQCPVPREVEPQCKKSNNTMRRTIYEQTSRILRPGMYSDQMVYDVMDESVRLEAVEKNPEVLWFESRFESGNLQMAIKVQPTEYDLILQSDIGSKPGRHNQWFYFSVRNMSPSISYKFNIINMSKGNSQFGEGMQPVIYSMKDGVWRRGGDNICFYKNHYRKPDSPKTDEPSSFNVVGSGPSSGKLVSSIPTYSTLTFHLKNPHQEDTIYIAYHYPYTVSDLTLFLDSLQVGGDGILALQKEGQTNTVKSCDKFNLRCRRQTLGSSMGGNKLELLTITAFDEDSINESPISDRIYIFLTARVHPGESNSSYIMHGVIQFLLGDDDTAHCLRQRCVFKIIPMLNPDGVIAGNHRCGLGGTDLNRAWQSPSPSRTPTIYWTKLLWKYLVDKGHRPLVSCDFHGHSKKKNVFIFGCENGPGLNDGIEKIFPSLLATLNPVFDSSNCKYTVERSKEATARVVMWRELGVVGSYTLESSYCGTDVGEKKGLQLQITDLEKVGVDFCCAVWASLGIFEGRVPIATPPPLITLQVRKEKNAFMSSGGTGIHSGTGAVSGGGGDSDSSCDENK